MTGFQASIDAATSGLNPAMLGIVAMAMDSEGMCSTVFHRQDSCVF